MRTLLREVAAVGLVLAGALLLGCGKTDVSTASSSDPPTQTARLEAGAAPQSVPVSQSVEVVMDVLPIVQAGSEPSETASSQTAESSATADAESAETVKTVTFDHIKFEMTKGDKFKQRMLTDKVKEMFGKNIRIRGYILPSFKQDGLSSFVLVRDNKECCFGPGAALFDCIAVKMVDNKTTSYTVRPVSVEGTFSFEKVDNPDPKRPGELLSIYRLDAVRVR